ncbi:Down syndrome cell adhesion molecule-like [Esox lucius]|uniref:Down syndrome cell adhesion molecule-like n=1 Tax=Esox lucius TaxID=8010 RepID=UPI001476F46C|nr:Down syndrome cell adhesion molecule-like [Esox lucius]
MITVYQSEYITSGNNLLISSVKVSDQGSYRCQGNQHDRPKITSSSNQVTITVQALPSATLTVDPNPVFTGEKVTLTCSVESDSDWERYQWYKDNTVHQSILSQYSGTTLTIKSVKESDKGLYWCLGISNSRPTSSSISNYVTLSVYALPKATLKFHPTSPFTGEKVTLTCSVGSYRNWSYKWYKDRSNNAVTQSDRHSITGDTLIISRVEESDQGLYWCQGERTHRPTSTSISESVYMSVNALPKATLTVDPNPVFTGEKVTLTCSVESDSDWARYVWYKDNTFYPNRLSQYSGATLTINSVKESDRGLYWCQGRLNSRGTTSDTSDQVTITVYALPKATLTVDPNPVFTGEKVTLTCSVGSYSDWKRYVCYKDNTYYQNRLSQYSGTTLTIYNVKESDQGLYWCKGIRYSRPTSSSISNFVTISVNALPTATLTLDPTSPYTGETVTLTCSVNSESNWRYNWYKDRIYIPVTQSGRLSIRENSLIISSVIVSDQGSYQCHGYLDDRTVSTSTSDQVTITVKALPNSTLTVEPISPYTGEKVNLTCSAGSDRDWRYKWYNNSSINAVTQSDRHSTTGDTLIISRVEESDQGLYWCQGERDSRPTSTSISNQVIITVKAPGSSTSLLVGVVVGLVVGVFLFVLLVLVCRYKNSKRSFCNRTSLSPQTQITNQDPQQDLLQHGGAHLYDTINPSDHNDRGDVTYALIQLNQLKKQKKGKPSDPTENPVYSEVQTENAASGPVDVTYAEIDLNKKKKKKKRGSTPPPETEPVYSEVKPRKAASGPVDVTYAEIDLNKKTKKKKKRGSTPPPETEPVYSEVKPRKGP